MEGSRLGLHVHRWNNRLLDYCKNVGAAVVKSLDHNEMFINEIKRAQPKTLMVARLWVPEQKLDDPIRRADEFIDQFMQAIDGCLYDVGEGYNEWDGDLQYHQGGPEGLENWKRYADFEARRSYRLHQYGLKSAVGGCSVGTPPEEWFLEFKPALEEGDFLHLHEYSAPRMWDHVNWHCLKYRFVYQYLEEHGLPILPLIISECGIDGGVCGRPREGWRKFGLRPVEYMQDWMWIDSKWREDRHVVGGCAFDCGSTVDLGWMSFNMDPEMLNQWTPYVKEQGVSWWEGVEVPEGPGPSPLPPEPSDVEWPDFGKGIGFHFTLNPNEESTEQGIAYLKSIQAQTVVVCSSDDEPAMKCVDRLIEEGFTPIWRRYATLNSPVNFYNQAEMALEHGCKLVQVYNEPTDSRDNPEGWPMEEVIPQVYDQACGVVAAGALPGLQFLDPNNLAMFIDYANANGATFENFWQYIWFSHHGYHLYTDTYKEPPDVHPDGRCFLGFLDFAAVFEEKLGFVPPIIITELSYQTPHAPVEWWEPFFTCYRDGVLPNGDPLPDYLKATCPWILAGGAMGLFAGQLAPLYRPVVEMLQAIPPFQRWKPEESLQDPEGEEEMTDSPLATWREGVPLGNYTRGPTKKSKIVLHSTDGTFTAAVNWFLSLQSEVSAHYIVGRGHAGEPKIYQMVKESDVAHHAGDWEMNTKSIGVECADDNLDYLTDPQRTRLIALLKDIVERHPQIKRGDVLLHREVVSTECPQAISDAEKEQILDQVFGEQPPEPDELEECRFKLAELEEALAESEEKLGRRKAQIRAAREILSEEV